MFPSLKNRVAPAVRWPSPRWLSAEDTTASCQRWACSKGLFQLGTLWTHQTLLTEPERFSLAQFPWEPGSFSFLFSLGIWVPSHINRCILRLRLGGVMQQNLSPIYLFLIVKNQVHFQGFWKRTSGELRSETQLPPGMRRQGESRLAYRFLFGYEYWVITLL